MAASDHHAARTVVRLALPAAAVLGLRFAARMGQATGYKFLCLLLTTTENSLQFSKILLILFVKNGLQFSQRTPGTNAKYLL